MAKVNVEQTDFSGGMCGAKGMYLTKGEKELIKKFKYGRNVRVTENGSIENRRRASNFSARPDNPLQSVRRLDFRVADKNYHLYYTPWHYRGYSIPSRVSDASTYRANLKFLPPGWMGAANPPMYFSLNVDPATNDLLDTNYFSDGYRRGFSLGRASEGIETNSSSYETVDLLFPTAAVIHDFNIFSIYDEDNKLIFSSRFHMHYSQDIPSAYAALLGTNLPAVVPTLASGPTSVSGTQVLTYTESSGVKSLSLVDAKFTNANFFSNAFLWLQAKNYARALYDNRVAFDTFMASVPDGALNVDYAVLDTSEGALLYDKKGTVSPILFRSAEGTLRSGKSFVANPNIDELTIDSPLTPVYLDIDFSSGVGGYYSPLTLNHDFYTGTKLSRYFGAYSTLTDRIPDPAAMTAEAQARSLNVIDQGRNNNNIAALRDVTTDVDEHLNYVRANRESDNFIMRFVPYRGVVASRRSTERLTTGSVDLCLYNNKIVPCIKYNDDSFELPRAADVNVTFSDIKYRAVLGDTSLSADSYFLGYAPAPAGVTPASEDGTEDGTDILVGSDNGSYLGKPVPSVPTIWNSHANRLVASVRRYDYFAELLPENPAADAKAFDFKSDIPSPTKFDPARGIRSSAADVSADVLWGSIYEGNLLIGQAGEIAVYNASVTPGSVNAATYLRGPVGTVPPATLRNFLFKVNPDRLSIDRTEKNFNYENQNISIPVTDSIYYDFLMNDPIKTIVPSLIYDALYMQTDSGKLFYGYVDTRGYVAWTEFTDLTGNLVDTFFGPAMVQGSNSLLLETGAQDAETSITKKVEFIPAVIYNRNVAYLTQRGNAVSASLNIVADENSEIVFGAGDVISTRQVYDGSPEIQISSYEDEVPNGLFIQASGATPFAILRAGRDTQFYGVARQ